MGLKRFYRFTFVLLVTTASTFALYYFERQYFRSVFSGYFVQWARQVAVHAETLSLYAREKQEPTPIAWAVRFLNVGTEDKPLSIESVILSYNGKNRESFQLDYQKKVFEYSKILTPENGNGIRIRINTGYLGFLGSPSPFFNDLWIGCTFLVLLLLVRGIFRPKIELESSVGLDPKFKYAIVKWIAEARAILMELGVSIKNLVRQANHLASASADSQQGVKGLLKTSEAIYLCVSKLEESFQESATQPETLELFEELKKLTEQSFQDTSNAVLAYEDIFRAAREMSTYITQTTDILMKEVKLIQELKTKAETQEPQVSKDTEESSENNDQEPNLASMK